MLDITELFIDEDDDAEISKLLTELRDHEAVSKQLESDSALCPKDEVCLIQ